MGGAGEDLGLSSSGELRSKNILSFLNLQDETNIPTEDEPIDPDDPGDDHETPLLSNYFFRINVSLAFVCSLITVLSAYVSFQVFKLIGFSKKMIMATLTFLTLNMASKIVSYSFNAHFYNDETFNYTITQRTFLTMTPTIFFTLAALLNLHSWIRYYFKIGQMASLVDERAEKFEKSNYGKRTKKVIKFLLKLIIAGLLAFWTWVATYSITQFT